jgi:hypothetical protein
MGELDRLHAAVMSLLERISIVTRPPNMSTLTAAGLAIERYPELFRGVSRRETGYAQSPRRDTPAVVLRRILARLVVELEQTPRWDTRDPHAPMGWQVQAELARQCLARDVEESEHCTPRRTPEPLEVEHARAG